MGRLMEEEDNAAREAEPFAEPGITVINGIQVWDEVEL